jgi:GMP synthase PP-ATPase subunit
VQVTLHPVAAVLVGETAPVAHVVTALLAGVRGGVEDPGVRALVVEHVVGDRLRTFGVEVGLLAVAREGCALGAGVVR